MTNLYSKIIQRAKDLRINPSFLIAPAPLDEGLHSSFINEPVNVFHLKVCSNSDDICSVPDSNHNDIIKIKYLKRFIGNLFAARWWRGLKHC